MDDHVRAEHIAALARIAAELAGRDPDEHIRLKLADVVAFDGVMWRYPDFLAQAEAAYETLAAVGLKRRAVFDLDGQFLPEQTGFHGSNAKIE